MPRVADLRDNASATGGRNVSDGFLGEDVRADRDAAAVAHGVRGVDENVHEHLRHLIIIQFDAREALSQFPVDEDVVRDKFVPAQSSDDSITALMSRALNSNCRGAEKSTSPRTITMPRFTESRMVFREDWIPGSALASLLER